jgi:hypothetical protein
VIRSVAGLVALSLLLAACRGSKEKPYIPSQADIQSVYTSLEAGSCKQETDQNDPNAASYQSCPGVAGYELIVRQVDSGRTSIDVVNVSRRVFPLNYQEFITRRMFSLGSNAEWRVATRGGKPVPIALIVRVRAHESNAEPEEVTNTYFAVAKIEPDRACVTARIPEGSQSDAEVRSAADSAAGNPCSPPQPPLTADGVVIR